MADEQVFNQMLEELKAIRQEKKIRLEIISEQSKIRLQYLRALEAGELDRLPHVYDRFIFKTYLQALHVEDPQKYLAAFDSVRKSERKQTTFFSAKSKTSLTSKEWIPKPLLLKIIYAGIPVLITIVLVITLINNQKKAPRPSEKPVKELTAQQIVNQARQRQNKKTPADTIETKQKSSLTIVIRAKGDSWIRYVKDHADTSDFILKSKNEYTIHADSVAEFRIGNPSVLVFEINSIVYDSLAKPGQVISYMKVTPSGIVKRKVVFPKKGKVEKNDSTSTH